MASVSDQPDDMMRDTHRGDASSGDTSRRPVIPILERPPKRSIAERWQGMKTFLRSTVGPAFRQLGDIVSELLPKGLYARALLIIITPIVILESVVAFVFMERHWESVTRRLSSSAAGQIAAVTDFYESYNANDNYRGLIDMARNRFDMSLQILPTGELPAARPKPFFDLLDRTLSQEIREHIDAPFWIDTIGRSKHVEVRIKLEDAVLRFTARRNQTYASNSHIFLAWMIGTSLVLLSVAIVFLRNQIKPILTLSQAVDQFGKGRTTTKELRPRGAREVRQAAEAFMDMRDRIEKHVEQRTTMLAGVSHDLRTILTRFKLQVAMLGDTDEAAALRDDINEMQLMLADYMAFTKGDEGEPTTPTDVMALMEEIRDEAAHFGKTLSLVEAPGGRGLARAANKQLTRLDASGDDAGRLIIPLRRHAFKRSIVNLVTNAARFGDEIRITVRPTRRWLSIDVEDDGPGIPTQDREDVFRPFYRLDVARNQDEGNTGLGLAIARDIARSHGGDIWLEDSNDLGGLKATARIPV
ncbi:MAG: ATP-binding protein [Pseudomonadota bacterium]